MAVSNLASRQNKTDEVKFRIQQLRLDKLTYTVDALALCFLVFLLLVSLPMFYPYFPAMPPQTPLVLVGLAVAGVFIALSSNVGRWLKLRKLERELSSPTDNF